MAIRIRYSEDVYKRLTKGLCGSLVCRLYEEKKCGVGIVLDHRLWHGDIHYKVGWIISPYIVHKELKLKEWVSFSTLFILSRAKEELS